MRQPVLLLQSAAAAEARAARWATFSQRSRSRHPLNSQVSSSTQPAEAEAGGLFTGFPARRTNGPSGGAVGLFVQVENGP